MNFHFEMERLAELNPDHGQNGWVQEGNGLGLQAEVMDYCKLVIKYPKGTNSTWVIAPVVFVFFFPIEFSISLDLLLL